MKSINVKACNNCGIIFVPTNNRQKYCIDCKKILRAERQRKWRSEHREESRQAAKEYYEAHRKCEPLAQKRERLTKEMLQLREKGLTNFDIAKKCELSYKVVHYYIGNEPVEYWKNAVRIGAKTRRAKNKLHGIGLNQRKKVWYEIQIREQQAAFEKALLDLDLKRKEYDEQQKKAFEEQQKLNELKKALEAC